MPNMFDETWNKTMKEMFEKAKNDRKIYESFIDSLEHRFNMNSDDTLVKFFVAQVRQILWPENQKISSLLEKIPNETAEETAKTFANLRQAQNYEKFAAHFNKPNGRFEDLASATAT